VAVVGSMNMDFVVRVPRLPGLGETVAGADVFRNPGGKGANQAVAAARLGQAVAMIASVGEDDPGHTLVESLRADGIDTSHVRVAPDAPTGVAFIAVGPDGENQIVVASGANARLGPAEVADAGPLLERAAVTLLQLEIPIETVRAAAQAARGTVVLNPAPAQDVPEDVLSLADVVVPNRVELARLAGNMPPPRSVQEAARVAGTLPASSTVVTLGDQGAVVVREGVVTPIASVAVRAVDTTAAGDAFCGALADALARGEELEGAARWAVRVAALTCTKPGAQPSLPTREEALAFA
jgi:ribokinase